MSNIYIQEPPSNGKASVFSLKKDKPGIQMRQCALSASSIIAETGESVIK